MHGQNRIKFVLFVIAVQGRDQTVIALRAIERNQPEPCH